MLETGHKIVNTKINGNPFRLILNTAEDPLFKM